MTWDKRKDINKTKFLYLWKDVKRMLVIIGKIMNKENKVEAVRIFDTVNSTCKDYSIKRARKAVRLGLEIIGLRKSNNAVNFENTNLFSFSKVTKINGSGFPLDNNDMKLVYSGWRGFAEMKRYYVIDYKGIEAEVNEEQFLNMVKNKMVNGASMSNSGRVYLYNKLDEERY